MTSSLLELSKQTSLQLVSKPAQAKPELNPLLIVFIADRNSLARIRPEKVQEIKRRLRTGLRLLLQEQPRWIVVAETSIRLGTCAGE